jgi:HK97 family phage major capsid protein
MKEDAMDPHDELLDLTRELRTTVQERFGELERRLRRVESDNPTGYSPADPGAAARAGERALAVGLSRGDSYADWAASRGRGRRLEPGEFSLGRLVQAMISGDRSQLTEFERQALTEGTDSAGGILVPEQLAPNVIDLVRARARVVEAGATVVPMGSDGYTWPRIVGGATPEWKDELEAMTESQLAFGALKLDAKTLRTKVVMSQELVEDMSPEGSVAIERELTNAFALEVDRAGLYGTGTKQPLGVKNQPGVQLFATPTAALGYDDLNAAAVTVRAWNHEPNATILSAQAEGILASLADTSGQPLQAPPGLPPRLVTNLVDAATTAGDVFTGQWDQLVIGVRPQLGVRIERVNARLAEDFAVEVVCWQRADVGLQDPKAFAVNPDVTVPAGFPAPQGVEGFAATAASTAGKPAAGATRAEWDAYAASIGIDPSGYGTKDELIAAVEAQAG